ncbi:5454_t:CDS:2 [Funneliformis mosseae]|uniref:U6 snRNA phosphodiesterase n=2 Tax=Funneliformis TaxID=1117308 RepID=A0A9N8YQW9_FUNMO|nr:5454_t:CDS:2 [Funneliformis mosseae]
MSELVDYESSDSEINSKQLNDISQQESNLSLVDYLSDYHLSDEEEKKNEIDKNWEENTSSETVLKRKEIYVLDKESTIASKKRGSILKELPRKDLPPLPSDFLQLYPGKKDYTKHIDDPSLHQGRIRTSPHVEGNWATHVYLEVVLTEEMDLIIKKIKKLTQEVVNEDGVKIFSCIEKHNVNDDVDELDDNDYFEETKLHISLSRPLLLKYHHIENFWTKIKKGFLNRKRFSLSFANIAGFSNDDDTRSFMALEVGKGSSELKSMVNIVNKVAKDFQQKPFYENPRFHASILWALGGSSIDSSLCDAIKETEFFELISQHIFFINCMVCKFGNKTYTLDLK